MKFEQNTFENVREFKRTKKVNMSSQVKIASKDPLKYNIQNVLNNSKYKIDSIGLDTHK